MKRVSKKFKPRGCNYRYWFRTYFDQPKGTVIAYYLRDDDNNYTAVCRHKLYLRPIILLITLIVCGYHIYTMEGTRAKVYVPKYITMRDNTLSLDLKYNKDSDVSCYYNLSVDGRVIIDGLLEPGKSIGNVTTTTELMEGDYPAILQFLVKDSYGHVRTAKKDVLLQVRNTAE